MDIENETAAALAHEVKNPLSIIKMNVDYLKSCLDKEYDENFMVIEREISKISAIVTGLSFKRQNVMLKELINGIITEYDISLKSKVINFDISGESDLAVTGDREKLNILFFNLIKNAVEAIDEKGDIKVKIEKKNGKAVTEICDSGGGMKDDVMKKIGQPYNTNKKGGTGLGLAICTSIINEHKGSIMFENAEKGCRVRIILNCA